MRLLSKLLSSTNSTNLQKFICRIRTNINKIDTKIIDFKKVRKEKSLVNLGAEITERNFFGIKIKAPKFNNLKQIKKFNKEILGIKYFDVQNKEMAEYLTDGLISQFNKCNKTGLIKKIKTISNPNIKSLMSYNNKTETVYIYKEILEELQFAAKKEGLTISQFMDKLGKLPLPGGTENFPRGKFNYLFHELGHAKHAKNSPVFDKLCSLEELKAKGITETSLTNEFLQDKEIQKIAGKISNYAQKSPAEFVAETHALLENGIDLPNDIRNLYKAYFKLQTNAVSIKPFIDNSNNASKQYLSDFINLNGYHHLMNLKA